MPTKRKRCWTAGQELLGKGNESWKAFLDAPKSGIDQALLDDLTARHATVMHDGVEPEFAALHAGDQAGFHAIADTKISPLFIAYDNAASAVVKALQRRAADRQTAAPVGTSR